MIDRGEALMGADIRQRIEAVHHGLSDAHLTLGPHMTIGNTVVWFWTIRGTHTSAKFMGPAPSGKEVSLTGVNIDRLENGRVVEHRESAGFAEYLDQLKAAVSS